MTLVEIKEGTYLRDGTRLVYVIKLLGERVLIEDCKTDVRETIPTRLLRDMTVVVPQPS